MATTIKWETAENMMNIVAFSACKACANANDDIDIDVIQQYARKIFEEYCEAMDITDVEEPEEEKEEEEEEEITGEDEMESIIYDVGGERGISASDARLLMRCVGKTIYAKHPFLSAGALNALMQIETKRIADDYGIKSVDIAGE